MHLRIIVDGRGVIWKLDLEGEKERVARLGKISH